MSTSREDVLDVDASIEKFRGLKKARAPCCASQCFMKAKEVQVQQQFTDVKWMMQQPNHYDLFHAILRASWFLSRGIGCERPGNRSGYRLPCVDMMVCKKFFCFGFGIAEVTLTRIVQGFGQPPLASVMPNPHMLIGRPSNAGKPELKEAWALEVERIAGEEGSPFPIPLPGQAQGETFLVLPPHFTCMQLYDRIKTRLAEAMTNVGSQPTFLSWGTFYELFNSSRLRHIHIANRTTGVCDECAISLKVISRLPDQTAEQQVRKAEAKEKLDDHIVRSRAARHYYRSCRAIAQGRSVTDHDDQELIAVDMDIPPGAACISFDAAAKLSIPNATEETMKQHFASRLGYNVNLFGVVDEGMEGIAGSRFGTGVIFEEGCQTHGANTNYSVVKFYLDNVARSEVSSSKHLVVFSDSCGGDNKNNMGVAYFAQRVKHGLHDVVTWCFLEVGHTKFSPDALFGRIRIALTKRNAFTVPDVLDVISKSSENSHGVLLPDSEFYDFKNMASCFTDIEGIKKNPIRQIRISALNVGGERSVLVTTRCAFSGPWKSEDFRPKRSQSWPELAAMGKVAPGFLTEARIDHIRRQILPAIPEEFRAWWFDMIKRRAPASQFVASAVEEDLLPVGVDLVHAGDPLAMAAERVEEVGPGSSVDPPPEVSAPAQAPAPVSTRKRTISGRIVKRIK